MRQTIRRATGNQHGLAVKAVQPRNRPAFYHPSCQTGTKVGLPYNETGKIPTNVEKVKLKKIPSTRMHQSPEHETPSLGIMGSTPETM